MENRKKHAMGGCQLHQLGDLGRGDGHRLIHDYIFPGFEKLPGDLEVLAIWRGHDEQPQRGVREHLFQSSVGDDVGITRGGLVRVALDHGGQLQPFDGGDQRSVKYASGHSETYQTNSNHPSS
jgi:hypothetical protein